MCLEGVSTRRVQDVTEKVTQELDGEFEQFRNRPIGEISYLIFDAVDLKVRHCGSVVDMAILLAYGVTPEGKREILGASASLSEAEVHWRDFFKHLQSRGLRGLRFPFGTLAALSISFEPKCSKLCPQALDETGDSGGDEGNLE